MSGWLKIIALQGLVLCMGCGLRRPVMPVGQIALASPNNDLFPNSLIVVDIDEAEDRPRDPRIICLGAAPLKRKGTPLAPTASDYQGIVEDAHSGIMELLTAAVPMFSERFVVRSALHGARQLVSLERPEVDKKCRKRLDAESLNSQTISYVVSVTKARFVHTITPKGGGVPVSTRDNEVAATVGEGYGQPPDLSSTASPRMPPAPSGDQRWLPRRRPWTVRMWKASTWPHWLGPRPLNDLKPTT